MRARINGIEMHFEIDGAAEAPPVVLHHPLATNLSFWNEFAIRLAPNWRVIRYDARGHGKSEASPAPYSLDGLADDCIALMNHLGVKRAAYVGLSMGGMVAQYLGLRYPDRFSCLVIASSSSRIPTDASPVWEDRIRLSRAEGMQSQVGPALGRWLAARARGDETIVGRCTEMIETTPVEGYVGWCHAIRVLDMTDRLSGIGLPVHVVVGEDDPATPVAASEAIQRAIPGATLAIVPNVSHMLAIEDPAAFAGAVTPFLDRHRPG